ncbi:hypothetical protein SEUCBS139899_008248 [Sporothrix eucalyptigena]
MNNPSKETVVTQDTIAHVENSTDGLPGMAKSATAYTLQESPRRMRKTGLERRLLWKQDLVLVPLLALVYFVTFLDRNSFGNGKLLGLTTELHMTDDQYSNAAQLFFVGYTVFMLPGNVFLRTVPPNYLIGVSIVVFGTILCGMSAAQSYGAVLATRILIGAAQAMVQGTGLYASLWYKRNEAATRGAIYFSTATLSGAFSGLIAYAIGRNLTEATTGRAPWRWLFIIEGVIGIAVGLTIITLLPAFPDRMRKGYNWLFTKEEMDLAVRRASSYNTTHATLSWRQVVVALRDPKVWMFACINAGLGNCNSTVGVFLPTFVNSFGFSTVDAQLFSAIPYSAAFVVLPTLAFISDRVNRKGPFVAFSTSLAAIGYILLLTVSSKATKVLAVVFLVVGGYSAVLLSTTWLGINSGGFTKRATTWAIAEMLSNIFSIVGTNVYKPVHGSYARGNWVSLALLLFSLLNSLALIAYYTYANHKRDRILTEYEARGETHPHTHLTLEDVQDNHINFRYVI